MKRVYGCLAAFAIVACVPGGGPAGVPDASRATVHRGAANATGVEYVEFEVSEPTSPASICPSHVEPATVGFTAGPDPIFLDVLAPGDCVEVEELVPGVRYVATAVAHAQVVDFSIWSSSPESIVWRSSELACEPDADAAAKSCEERGASTSIYHGTDGHRVRCVWYDPLPGGWPIWLETWDSCNDVIYAPRYVGPTLADAYPPLDCAITVSSSQSRP